MGGVLKGTQVVGTRGREARTRTEMRPAGKRNIRKTSAKQRRRQNASLCLLAVEPLFEMKIQSV